MGAGPSLGQSEDHIGAVGGALVVATATFARPADTTAYAANDAVSNGDPSVLMTFAGLPPSPYRGPTARTASAISISQRWPPKAPAVTVPARSPTRSAWPFSARRAVRRCMRYSKPRAPSRRPMPRTSMLS
jgi:hypothetical protein